MQFYAENNSIHPTLETSCQLCRLFKATTAYTSACIGSAVKQRNKGTPLGIRPKIMARYEDAAVSLDDCCRLVLPYHAVQHATDETDP